MVSEMGSKPLDLFVLVSLSCKWIPESISRDTRLIIDTSLRNAVLHIIIVAKIINVF